jgi:hypothetical protein
MNPAFPTCPSHTHWKSLYRAAIFEKDRSVVPERISQAEQAILARRKQILYTEGTREERNALDHTLHALRAFSKAWKRRAA